jgi:hypothetical protein
MKLVERKEEDETVPSVLAYVEKSHSIESKEGEGEGSGGTDEEEKDEDGNAPTGSKKKKNNNKPNKRRTQVPKHCSIPHCLYSRRTLSHTTSFIIPHTYI